MRLALALLAWVAAIVLSPTSHAQPTGPTISPETVPTVVWSISLNGTVPLTNGAIDTTSAAGYIYAVVNQTFTQIDGSTGQVVYTVNIPLTDKTVCFQPAVDPDDTLKSWVACQPNYIYTISKGSITWSSQIFSNVILPLTGDKTPIWDGPAQVAKNGVMPFVLLTGSGALFTTQGANPGYPQYQFGPSVGGLFNVESNITTMQVMNTYDAEGGLLITAQGTMPLITSITPTAIFYTKVPQGTGKWDVSNLIQFGNTTYPNAGMSMTWVGESSRIYVGAAHYTATSEMKFEMFQFTYPFSTQQPNRWLDLDQTYFATGFPGSGGTLTETSNGHWLIPFVVQEGLPLVNTVTGHLDRWYRFNQTSPTIINGQETNLLSLTYSKLFLDYNNLYIFGTNILAVADLSSQSILNNLDELPFQWSFSYTQDPVEKDVFPSILPASVPEYISLLPRAKNSDLLIVRTTYWSGGWIPSLYPDTSDRLWAFSSMKAPSCAELPNSSDNCGYCDDQAGSTTARNCAYCSESSVCTEYYFNGIPAFNQTCSDDPYPLDMHTCNGKNSDRNVAIIVGVVCGSIILLSIGICYLAKKKTQADASARESPAVEHGNYQSVA